MKAEWFLGKVVVTGCAGFIGSNLVDFLLKNGNSVIGIDNLKTGHLKFLEKASLDKNFIFHNHDLFEYQYLSELIKGCDVIFHLAANADVRYGGQAPRRDLEQNTIVTHNVLEAARNAGIINFVFSSTGSIYGESKIIPTPEESPFPIQTSLYGASKLACEGLIQAYSETFGLHVWIFRFVSILGPRYSHGHVYDFYNQLRRDPSRLKVLGNGQQTKSYLHVHDCLEGIKLAMQKSKENVNIFNLGIDGTCKISESINWITEYLNLNPKIEYGLEDRGWIGDNPLIYLETKKIRSLGWTPEHSIKESVTDTVKYLQENSWLQHD